VVSRARVSGIYRFSAEEAARGRAAMIDQVVVPFVAAELARSPATRSAMLLIAQYWNDNADDEVHGHIVFSTEAVPDPAQVRYVSPSERRTQPHYRSYLDGWNGLGEAISLFAAFAPEGADQNMELCERSAPYAIFTRAGAAMEQRVVGAAIEQRVVGAMLRPWLDGIHRRYELEAIERATDARPLPDPGEPRVLVTDIVDDWMVVLDPLGPVHGPGGGRPLVLDAACIDDAADAIDRFERLERPVAVHWGDGRWVGRVRKWPRVEWRREGVHRRARLIVDPRDDEALREDLVRCQAQCDPRTGEGQAALVRVDAELERLGRGRG
jgi:hypothetical protein